MCKSLFVPMVHRERSLHNSLGPSKPKTLGSGYFDNKNFRKSGHSVSFESNSFLSNQDKEYVIRIGCVLYRI